MSGRNEVPGVAGCAGFQSENTMPKGEQKKGNTNKPKLSTAEKKKKKDEKKATKK